jgi:AraC-like DNA-binding protein
VELRGTARDASIYETHLGCAARFGARHHALVFAREDLDRPFLSPNADLFAVIAPQLDAELKKTRSAQAVGDRVKSVLQRLLAGRRPGIADVARELGLSARTLQRRLTEDGLSFQQLLQDARRELARHYLLNSALELNETAYLLGYEDAHSFFRAFQQWEGSSPGAWRSRHQRRRRPEATVA